MIMDAELQLQIGSFVHNGLEITTILYAKFCLSSIIFSDNFETTKHISASALSI